MDLLPLADCAKTGWGTQQLAQQEGQSVGVPAALPQQTRACVQVVGKRLVLFRDSTGAVRCINDVCPHRGAPLYQPLPFPLPLPSMVDVV